VFLSVPEALDKGALTKWGIPLMSGCSSEMKIQFDPMGLFVQRFLDKGALTKWGIPLMSGCSSEMKIQFDPMGLFVQRFVSSRFGLCWNTFRRYT